MPGIPTRYRKTIITLIVAAVTSWFAGEKGWLPPEIQDLLKNFPKSAPSEKSTGKWEELTNCRLVPHKNNDGDSFLIRHGREELTVRLYFVDCPEKYRNKFNGERLADQGKYFGGLNEAQTIKLGLAAQEFTQKRLNAGPFTVLTRREPVFNASRRYAFIRVGKRDLGEMLVEAGLARIYTKGASRPGGVMAEEKAKLISTEAQAKRARRGGWTGGRNFVQTRK